MIRLEQLDARLHPPPGVALLETIMIEDERDLAAALFTFFGESDDREAVRLVVAGNEIGYVERDQLLSQMEQRHRGTGFGASAGFRVPGIEPYPTIRLHCPVPDCVMNPILAKTFDPEYPPHCPEHQEQVLEREL
jgi:hypothetical protein